MKTIVKNSGRQFSQGQTDVNELHFLYRVNRNGLYLLAILLSAMFSMLLYSNISRADSPVDILSPDRHSIEVKGKINLYRVQVEGMGMGKDIDKVNAEVFVTLDSNPKMVYALDLHSDSPASNRVIADTLRDAYISKVPVTLYHQIGIRKANNFKILMVQLDR